MPFKSEKQRRYMYANHPKIAKRWSNKYGSKIKGGRKRKRRTRKGSRTMAHSKRTGTNKMAGYNRSMTSKFRRRTYDRKKSRSTKRRRKK